MESYGKARGAGGSIKPGAQAPGSRPNNGSELTEWAIAVEENSAMSKVNRLLLSDPLIMRSVARATGSRQPPLTGKPKARLVAVVH
jgi:hypothetical protein